MPVAGTKKYQVKTGTQPEVTVSVHFTQKGEKFFVPIPYELYVKLSDQERKDIGVVFMESRQVVVGDKFSEAFQKYTKVLDVAHDTVEGIECSPMIFVKFDTSAFNGHIRKLSYDFNVRNAKPVKVEIIEK